MFVNILIISLPLDARREEFPHSINCYRGQQNCPEYDYVDRRCERNGVQAKLQTNQRFSDDDGGENPGLLTKAFAVTES